MKRIIFRALPALALCCAAFSCAQKENNLVRYAFREEPKEQRLIKSASYQLPYSVVPTQMLYCGGNLVVNNFLNDTVLTCLRIEGSKISVLPYAERGSDSTHVLSASTLAAIDDKNFAVYDLTKTLLVKFNVEEAWRSNALQGKYVYQMSEDNKTCYAPMVLTDSTIVAPHYKPSKHRLTFLNLNNGTFVERGDYPPTKDVKGVPPNILAQSYQCIPSRNDRYLVLANRFTDKIEVRNMQGDLLYYLSGPVEHDSEFDVGKTKHGAVMRHNSKRKIDFIDSEVLGSKLYVLYLGANPDEHINEKEPNPMLKKTIAGDVVYVYDLDKQTLLQKIRLDEKAFCMGVDPSQKKLYTFNPKNRVSVYEL